MDSATSKLLWASEEIERLSAVLYTAIGDVIERHHPVPTPDARSAVIIAALAIILKAGDVPKDKSLALDTVTTNILRELSRVIEIEGLADALAILDAHIRPVN